MSGSSSQLASMQSFLTASVMALTWMSRMARLLLLARAHRREGRLSAPADLLRRQGLLVGGQAPAEAERILHLAIAVAPEHVGHRHPHGAAGGGGPLEGCVDVGDVQIERHRRALERERGDASTLWIL